MMKKILALLLACMTLFTFAACEGLQYQPSNQGQTGGFGQTGGDSTGGDSTGGDSGGGDSEVQQTYTVKLTYGGAPYDDTEGVKAQWSNGYDYHTADFVNGVATMTGLSEDYSVTLLGLDEDYSYNPGDFVNKATRFTPDLQIPIYRLTKARGGTGNNEYDCKTCRDVGVFRTVLNSHGQKVFYEFEPKENGVYTISSWVNVEEGLVNPKIYVYNGSSVYKIYAYTLDEGGVSKGFTRNFVYSFNVDQSNVGGVWTFAIGADHRQGIKHDYAGDPIEVDFAVMRDGGFVRDSYKAPWMLPNGIYAEFANTLRHLQTLTKAEFDAEGDKYGFYESMEQEYEAVLALTEDDLKDADSLHYALNVTIRYADTTINAFGKEVKDDDCAVYKYLMQKLYEKWTSYQGSGTLLGAETDYTPVGGTTSVLAFRGENYQVSPVTGVYHCYDVEKYANDPYGFGAGYGPVLFGKISVATRFFDETFVTVEQRGNKALTVSNGTENYKLFIEGFAHIQAMANSDIGGGQLQGYPGDFDPDKYYGFLGYNDFVNSDGLTPVTPELKEFFQKYSVNQRLFNDGNGVAEEWANPKVDALEEDQWLFACCYYSNP